MFKKQEVKAPDFESVETLLGKDFSIEGSVKSGGSVRIDGSVKGEINVSGDLIIGETAIIEGTVRASNLYMSGKVIGNMFINGQLKLTSTAKVIGDIEVKKFIIDEGAVFQGNCTMNAVEEVLSETIEG